MANPNTKSPKSRAAKKASKQKAKKSKTPTLIIAFDLASKSSGFAMRMMEDDTRIPGSWQFSHDAPTNDDEYFERKEAGTLPQDFFYLYGSFDTKSSNIETRCRKIHEIAKKLIDSHRDAMRIGWYNLVIVLEQARPNPKFRHVYPALRAAHSAVWCAAPDIPVRYVAPAQLRSFLGLKGNANKEDIANAVLIRATKERREDLKHETQDCLDAMGIVDAFAAGFMTKHRIGRVN